MNLFLIIIFLFILILTLWAIFSKDIRNYEEEAPESPEKIFRRRSNDKDIEEKYPDIDGQHYRRKNDIVSDKVKDHDITDVFRLPYMAEEIVSEASRFRIYKRILLNAEIYAKRGDFSTAVSLFEGVNDRINNLETNNKISANIDYIEQYKMMKLEREKEALEKESIEKKANEIKLSFDGPISVPERIQIGLTEPPENLKSVKATEIDTDKIAEEITKKIFESKIIANDRDNKIEKYKSEIEELKDSINRLMKSKEEVDIDRDNKIEKYKSEIEELKDSIDRLKKLKEEESIDRNNDIERYKLEIDEIKSKTNELIKSKEEEERVQDKIRREEDIRIQEQRDRKSVV